MLYYAPMSVVTLYGEWLTDELSHQRGKYDHAQQVNQVSATPLTSTTNFGGNAASYWGRMLNNRRAVRLGEAKAEDVMLVDTQLIGKLTPSITALWRTMRTIKQPGYNGSDVPAYS